MEYLKERKGQILTKGSPDSEARGFVCDKPSTAGSVSQRACVFCGSRVVLYPIADALHLIHGPIGCAAYTWDIRGSLSSGPQIHRLSFSTDLRERDVVFGGEKKLYASLSELIDRYNPKAAFVYSTCIVGVIGDDLEAVCKKVGKEKGIDIIPCYSEGFRGTKKDGYKIACEAIYRLVGTSGNTETKPKSINILGDFNLAGELWILKDYYERIGVNIICTCTGDGRVDDIRDSHTAALNVVQCSGSMNYLGKLMEKNHGIPQMRVSYFGIEDMADALYEVATFFNDKAMLEKARKLVSEELLGLMPELEKYKKDLVGKKAAIYVGGAFKAISLIKALKLIGIKTVVVGSQTGSREDYQLMRDLSDEGTIIVDDTNPLELTSFVEEKGADILIGGVKERPIAYKLGFGFCDHNHERKEALAGFKGMLNFAKEVHSSIMSPVWQFKGKRRE